MTERLEQVRRWLDQMGSGGAAANARAELERRAFEHAMLDALAIRVPAARTRDSDAAAAA